MGASRIDLIFFRHGLADWSKWKDPDDDRPLNDDGRRETHEVAECLVALDVRPEIILTSPLPRAWQTADIVAGYLGAPVETTKHLDKRFGVGPLERLLKPKMEAVMLVGHEPNFSEVIEQLTGGMIKLRKSGVARVRLDPKTMRGRLEWLLTPKLCQPKKQTLTGDLPIAIR